MEIILLERVENLGQMGDVVTVKDGYARNFLLPQKKALRATEANKTLYEQRRKEIEAKNLAARKEAEAVAKKLAGKSIVLLRQAGETDQLYGSVTTRDIAEALGEDGVSIDRKQVVLARPIKEIGTHAVEIKLHPEVEASITANVARSNEEAELQAGGPAIPEAEKIFETKELAEAAEKALAEDVAAEEEAAGEEEPAAEGAASEEAAESSKAQAAGEEKPAKKAKKSKKSETKEKKQATAEEDSEAATPGKEADKPSG